MTSVLIVSVPEADPVIGGWRLRHTLDAPAGIPPHVTVLSPFVPAEQTGAVTARLAELVAAVFEFDVVFSRAARFPEVLYLDPEPAEPFLALTETVAAEWPGYPPYEGAFDSVIPHLTVAESGDQALLDRIAAEVEPRLPIETRVREVHLYVQDDAGRWHERQRLPLAA